MIYTYRLSKMYDLCRMFINRLNDFKCAKGYTVRQEQKLFFMCKNKIF